MRLARRDVFIGAGVAPIVWPRAGRAAKRPKIAAVCTVFFKHSHAQHIVGRFLDGYGWNGGNHHPAMDLVSLYVEQIGASDLSRKRLERFPAVRSCKTIAEALTLGGSKLAVDGVLLVGEHGDYPVNDRKQTMYPRYEHFMETVKVFKQSGRVVPVFLDKHLSWNWDKAKEMYDVAKAMRIPFQAGSSLPVTWRIPSVEMPPDAKVSEALCIAYGGPDSYDFHALETNQCMIERRKGGETGVKWVEAYRGEKFWKAWDDGLWPQDLVNACFSRSHTLAPARPGMGHMMPSPADLRRLCKDPYAYRSQHSDGLVSSVLMFSGLVEDFNFAARIDGRKDPFSLQMYLPMPPIRCSQASFFSPLVNNIETMFLSGKPTSPIERTLLTTGLTAAGVQSLSEGQKRIDTPHLGINYAAPRASNFWRT